MKDIMAVVFFAELANAGEWIEIYLFTAAHGDAPRTYPELPNGISSHDTIQRAFAPVSPEYLREFRGRRNEIMSGGTGGKLKKLLTIDGKTQRGNGNGWRYGLSDRHRAVHQEAEGRVIRLP
jgi:hypothetical protein